MTFAHKSFFQARPAPSTRNILTADNWVSGDQSAAFDAVYGGCQCDYCVRQRSGMAAGTSDSEKDDR